MKDGRCKLRTAGRLELVGLIEQGAMVRAAAATLGVAPAEPPPSPSADARRPPPGHRARVQAPLGLGLWPRLRAPDAPDGSGALLVPADRGPSSPEILERWSYAG